LARLFVLFSGDHPEFARTMLSRGHALFESLPFGKLVCVVDVVGCQPTTSFSRANRPDLMERDLGNFSRGRYAWRLENPRPFSDPPKAVGKQGFFFVRLSPLQMRQVGIKEAA
jgi:hypothetical protein